MGFSSLCPHWKPSVTCTTSITLNMCGQERLKGKGLKTELSRVPRTPLLVQVSKAYWEPQWSNRWPLPVLSCGRKTWASGMKVPSTHNHFIPLPPLPPYSHTLYGWSSQPEPRALRTQRPLLKALLEGLLAPTTWWHSAPTLPGF